MSDMISRQKLIEAVKKEYYQFIDDDTDLAYNRAISDVIKVIESQPPADSGTDICVGTNQWIPCSERLPEANEEVLVSTRDGEVGTDFYGSWTRDFVGLKGTGMEAIAWQPLPKPYKGE